MENKTDEHEFLNDRTALTKSILEEVTKAELIAYATLIGIVNYSGRAKRPTQPTKLEIANAINLEQGFSVIMELPDELAAGVDTTGNITPEETDNPSQELSASALIRIQRDVLNMKKRIHVTLNPEAERDSIEEDSTDVRGDPIVFVTWGNDAIGYSTDKIVFNTPWVCRIGAVNNLRNAYAFVSYQDGNSVKTKRVSKYNVKVLDPFTKAELEELREQQRYIEQEAKRQAFISQNR